MFNISFTEEAFADEGPVAVLSKLKGFTFDVTTRQDELPLTSVEIFGVDAVERTVDFGGGKVVALGRPHQAGVPLMGLDIYLEEQDEAAARNARNETAGDGDYQLSPKPDSDKYPDHFFKKTYLRSSYNDGGFNCVAERLIGQDLYDVFQPPDKQYEWVPTREELGAARERALNLLENLKQAVSDPLLFDALTVSHNSFSGKPAMISEQDAIRLVRGEMERFLENKEKAIAEGKNPDWVFGSYSSIKGDFWLDSPVQVLAAIPTQSILDTPGFTLVYRPKHQYEWYVQAAEIVVEFIDTALSMRTPLISWSS